MNSTRPLAPGIILVDASPPRNVLACSSDSVYLYNASSWTVDRTWTLSDSEKPTALAYDPWTKKCHVASNNQGSTLLTWRSEDDTPSLSACATTLPLSRTVSYLFPIQSSSEQQQERAGSLILVYEDGSLDLYISGVCTSHVDSSRGSVCLHARLFHSPPPHHHRDTDRSDRTDESPPSLCVSLVIYSFEEKKTIYRHVCTSSGSSLILRSNNVLLGHPSGQSKIPETITVLSALVCSRDRVVLLYKDGHLEVYSLKNTHNRRGKASGENEGSPLLSPGGTRTAEEVGGEKFKSIFDALTTTEVKKTEKKRKPSTRKRQQVIDSQARTPQSPSVSLRALGTDNLFAVCYYVEDCPHTIVRVDVVHTLYLCLQQRYELTAEDVGVQAIANVSAPIQVSELPSTRGLVVLAGGSGGTVLHIPPLYSASLASLVASQKRPMKKALQTISAPVEVEFHAVCSNDSSNTSLSESSLDIRPLNDIEWQEKSVQTILHAEQEAWEVLERGGDLKKLVKTVLKACAASNGGSMSFPLLGKLLIACAGASHWEGASSLLSFQHPGSLRFCPGLAASLAKAQKCDLLEELLSGSRDIPSDDIASLIDILLAGDLRTEASGGQSGGYRDTFVRAVERADRSLTQAETCAGKGDELGRGKASSVVIPNGGALGAKHVEYQVALLTVAQVSGFRPPHLVLHSLVKRNHDDGVLLDAFCKIKNTHLELLKYLKQWLVNHSTLLSCTPSPGADIPSLSQVVQWIGLLIDASLAQFVLTPDVIAPLFVDMDQLVTPEIKELQRLSKLKGVIEHVQCGAPLPPDGLRSSSGYSINNDRYSVQFLDLSIK